jgi:hypothetical protein
MGLNQTNMALSPCIRFQTCKIGRIPNIFPWYHIASALLTIARMWPAVSAATKMARPVAVGSRHRKALAAPSAVRVRSYGVQTSTPPLHAGKVRRQNEVCPHRMPPPQFSNGDRRGQMPGGVYTDSCRAGRRGSPARLRGTPGHKGGVGRCSVTLAACCALSRRPHTGCSRARNTAG